MSRARQTTTLHAVADTTAQAVEDIQTDWATDRHQRWISQTAAPAPDGIRARPVDVDRDAQRQRLRAEREQLLELGPRDVQADLGDAIARHTRLAESLRDLRTGRGEWRDSYAGDAARVLIEARSRRKQAEAFARMPDVSWRTRRHWHGQARRWAEQETLAQQQWSEIGEPIVADLTAKLEAAKHDVNGYTFLRERRASWLREHPDLEQRLHHIDRALEATVAQERLHNVRVIEGHDLGIEL